MATEASISACGKTSKFIGAVGTLRTYQHAVSGMVEIIDDCTFRTTAFNYDGQGPDAYWIITNAADSASFRTARQLMMLPRAPGAYRDIVADIKLPAGVTFESIAGSRNQIAISVWCVAFSANFADVVLVAPAAVPPSTATVGGSTVATSCPERFGSTCLANCVRMAPFLNVWWQVQGPDVVFELEADVDAGSWVAFGISGSNSSTRMVGADVAVTYFDSNSGQAGVADYMLTKQSQCNYNAGADTGVCPDEGVTCAGKKGTADVAFVSGSRTGTLQRIRYRRALDTSDTCDQPYGANGNVVVWGMGPITPASTLVVNIHSAVSNGEPRRLNVFDAVGTASFDCVLPPVREVKVAPSCNKKQLVTGVKSFPAVTVANYVSYPNPPSWGVSIQFGTFGETPEIVVERGETYSFNLMTTDAHPFYIVDNEKGGRLNESERVFAGSADSWGTAAAPKTLTWTVQQDAPAIVYYQCWTHIKLGWRIYVVDKGSVVNLPADTATRCRDPSLFPPTTEATFSVATIVTKAGTCSRTSKYVGATGKLSEREHQVSGVVRIIDDCTVEITSWTFDGNAPDAYIVVAPNESQAALASGVKILNLPRGASKSAGSTIRARLPEGQTWESLAGPDGVAVSAWCVAFSANFGSVLLTPPVTKCADEACCNAVAAKAVRRCSQCAMTMGCAFVDDECKFQSSGGIRELAQCADRCENLSCGECIGASDEAAPSSGVPGCVWCDAGRASGTFNTGTCSLNACSLGERVQQRVCYSSATRTTTLSALALLLLLLLLVL
jgi:hypothetical protein